MKKLILENTVEDEVIGVFTEDEYIDKVRLIAQENEDFDVIINTFEDAEDYIYDYCDNLESYLFIKIN